MGICCAGLYRTPAEAFLNKPVGLAVLPSTLTTLGVFAAVLTIKIVWGGAQGKGEGAAEE